MFKLSDREAAKLAALIVLYFEDCVKEDPTTTHPGNLTVRELVEDLAASTSGPEQREIETALDALLDLF